jgi:hypothetical protein
MAATRGDWKTPPLPPARKPIPFDRLYTANETAQIKERLIPQTNRNSPMHFFRSLKYSSAGSVVRALVVLALLGAFVAGQEAKKESPPVPKMSAAEKLVQEQLEAYNRHDIDAFLKTYSAEIKLYEFPDKEISSGQGAMRKTYGRLFDREPDRKARIAKRIVQGDYVIDHEEVSGGGREFKAVAIYQVKDDKIVSVWFLK